jgi:2,3-bisphosphoglycerate-independent phosphoglycerate mutase
VPFIIYKPGAEPDSVERYDEESAKNGAYGMLANGEFIRALFA